MSDEPTPSPTRLSDDLLIGTGLGLLLGLLVGLSASPVVAALVTALAALLAAAFGLDRTVLRPKGEEATPRIGSPRRIGAFGLMACLGLLLGIGIRTHDLLAPGIEAEIASWTAAGYSEELAREVVLVRRTGLRIAKEGAETTGTPKEQKPGVQNSLLFSGPSSDECASQDPDRFPDTAELLRAWSQGTARWQALATAAQEVGAPRPLLLRSWELACK